MLGALRQEWAPQAFVVSFKLETDEAILLSKVRSLAAGGPQRKRQLEAFEGSLHTCAPCS